VSWRLKDAESYSPHAQFIAIPHSLMWECRVSFFTKYNFGSGSVRQFSVAAYKVCVKMRFKNPSDLQALSRSLVDVLINVPLWVNDNCFAFRTNEIRRVSETAMKTMEQTNTADTKRIMTRWIKRIPALLILGFLSFRLFQIERFKAPKHVDLAALKIASLDGSPIPMNAIAGKAIVLNFWAPWCPPCRVETPWLQQLQATHPDNVLVIGVVADADQYVQAKSFMASRGVTYPLARETSSIDNAFGTITGLPTTLYIAPSGLVVHAVSGLIPKPLMTRYVDDALRH
jgi:thiol-disulfide isomerase/thioredoxin